jgi:flagellar assembly protein FliH
MSSKVLSGDAALPATPLQWEPVTSLPGIDPAEAVSFAAAGSARPAFAQSFSAELEGEVQRRAAQEREAGFREGLAEGARKSKAELEPLFAQLARTIDEVSGLKSQIRAEAEGELVTLAVAIARKIIHREVTIDPDALLGLVKAALGKLDARELHRVRMNPQDVETLRRHMDQIGGAGAVELHADYALPRGAAIFETSRGVLDASVETQLAEIERGFADLLHRR